MACLDLGETYRHVQAVFEQYEKSAPTVSAWADDVYRRMNSDLDSVKISELIMLDRLFRDGEWESPSLAANAVYKLMYRLGQDTSGHAGY